VRIAALLPIWLGICFSQSKPLLDILQQELTRNFETLKAKGDPAPYYIAYAVTEQEIESASATRGAVQGSNRRHHRLLDVTVRAGTPQLDSYHRLRGELPRFTSGAPISLDDNAEAIQQRLWMETDRVYRQSAQRLANIRSSQEVKVAEKDSGDDFTMEQPAQFSGQPPALRFNAAQWTARLRKVSQELGKDASILASQVSVSAIRETKSMVDSAGTRLQHGRIFARIMITAQAKAPDGMDLETSESFEVSDPSRLPGDEEIGKAVARVRQELLTQLRAPVVDPSVGPAILSGRAAGVFFHEIFGHRVEGHRQKDENEGQTFAKSIGTAVLPDFLSVVFDPTLKQAGGKDLNGSYLYDDEGVSARRVPLVERGALKTFLMSRAAAAGVSGSNGHGRREPGAEVVARQSNLLVESSRQVPDARLRQMLIEEIKRQNKPYGYFFQQVTGGYTTTGRRGFQAFKVIPLVVYRVYPDGRPDEPVRGADIVGTPLASFSKIIATGDRVEVFNGFCGAESGNVPVSAVSPAILVSELEVQKKESAQDRPPLLAPPSGGVQ